MSQRKRIVMLGTSFDSQGGVSSVINGYREAGLFQRFPIRYLATHSNGSALTKLKYCITSWLTFQGLLMCNRVALLHVHTSSNASFWRKLLFFVPAFVCRVPTILHLHGGAFDRFYERNNNRVKKYLIRTVFDNASTVIVLSETRKHWVRTISSNPHIEIIYNAVLMPAQAEFDVRDPATILFLGQLSGAKGVYDLLEAASRLLPEFPDLSLLLAGDGAQHTVQQTVDRMGLSRHVSILGWVTGPAKTALLHKATVYTLPSYAEGMPMSVLEAMAAGMPVVATAVGGIPEAISDGVEGTLIAPGDVAALTEALRRLLRRPDLRKKMSVQGRLKAEQMFSYEQIIPKIEKLYSNLASHT